MLKSCLRSVSDLELRTWFKLWPRNYKHIISCKRQTLYHLPSLWWNYLFNYFNGYLNNCTTFLVYAPTVARAHFISLVKYMLYGMSGCWNFDLPRTLLEYETWMLMLCNKMWNSPWIWEWFYICRVVAAFTCFYLFFF